LRRRGCAGERPGECSGGFGEASSLNGGVGIGCCEACLGVSFGETGGFWVGGS